MAKKNNPSPPSLNDGYTMPSAVDLEEALLGALILEPNAITKITNITIKEHFYKPRNLVIFEAIIYLHEISDSVDILILTQELRTRGVISEIGGAGYIAELTNKVPDASKIKSHAKIIQQKYIEREFLLLTEETKRKLRNGDNAYIVKQWVTEKYDNLFLSSDNEGKTFKDTVIDALLDIKGRMEGTVQNRRLTNTSFDTIFDLSPDELIILAALPKIGKTKTLIKIISALFKVNPDVASKWFTLEDPTDKIIRHFGAIETGIKISRMEAKDKDDKLSIEEYAQLIEASKLIEDYDISLVYGSYTVEKIVTETLSFIKKRKDKHNFIIIDNFNILVDNVTNMRSQLEKENHVSGKLRNLRIETNSNGYDTTLIVLDHLNKSIFDGGLDKGFRPTESTLKGTGAKNEMMTQLVFMNKPSRFAELIEQYEELPPITLNKVEWEVTDLLKTLTIYEVIMSRNGGSESGIPVRWMTDLNTMEFVDFEKVKSEDEIFEKREIFIEKENEEIPQKLTKEKTKEDIPKKDEKDWENPF